MFVLQFKIPFQNPFGQLAYHNGACASTVGFKRGDKILVSDRNGNMSCQPATIHSVGRAGRAADDYGCIFIGEFK